MMTCDFCVGDTRGVDTTTTPKGNNGNCASNASKKGCVKKGCAWDKDTNTCGEASTTSGQKALNTVEEATAAKEMPDNSGNGKTMSAAWTVMFSLFVWFQWGVGI